MPKTYLTAPLPFQGQKRIFLRRFKERLKRITNQITVIVDLFGGSGLLSHTAKRLCPWCEVIYNDFDDFHVRLEHVKETNEILEYVRDKVKGLKPKQRVPDAIHDQICDYLEQKLKEYGYLDWITLGCDLLFANNHGDTLDFFRNELFWVRVPKTNYKVDGYLDGISVVKKDYSILIQEVIQRTGWGKNVLFIADPPYMGTNVDSYADKTWSVQDYLKVPMVLDGKNFIYFTSMKSKILETYEFFCKNKGFQSPFFSGRVEDVCVSLSYVGQYTDVMVSHFLPGCYQEEPLLPQIDERLIYNKIDF